MEKNFEEGVFTPIENNGALYFCSNGDPNSEILIIGSFCNTLSKTKEGIFSKFKQIKENTKKKYILVDFKDCLAYNNSLKKHIHSEDIITWNPYTSSNGSNMIVSLIKLR